MHEPKTSRSRLLVSHFILKTLEVFCLQVYEHFVFSKYGILADFSLGTMHDIYLVRFERTLILYLFRYLNKLRDFTLNDICKIIFKIEEFRFVKFLLLCRL